MKGAGAESSRICLSDKLLDGMNSKCRCKAAMHKNLTNIVLIGMPGSGKSTIGVILAKLTGRDFIDTDVLIQTTLGRTLQDIVDTQGHMALREVEELVLLKLDCRNHVIATGGSAVYSHAAMTHLKSNGIAVFLNVALPVLEARIHDYETRGLAKRPDQSFDELFEERSSLYRKYADVTIECKDFMQEEVCEQIVHAIKQFRINMS
jgi:shikimate kinase